MKKIFSLKSIGSLMSIAVLMLACSDELLDQQNDNATSTANFGTSVAQVEAAVNR